jgi:hypothetical protein
MGGDIHYSGPAHTAKAVELGLFPPHIQRDRQPPSVHPGTQSGQVLGSINEGVLGCMAGNHAGAGCRRAVGRKGGGWGVAAAETSDGEAAPVECSRVGRVSDTAAEAAAGWGQHL